MKFSITRLAKCLFIAFIFPLCLPAQQFKWVHGGGTGYVFSIYLDLEKTEYMCTDPNGNVYALSQVGNDPIYADTFDRSSAYGARNNILLTSYNCNGQMRWAKLLASSVDGSYANGIIADSNGHVYIAGYIPNGTAYIGYDTAITGLANESSAVMQFDTNGHFNWIRDVGDNSFATIAGTGVFGCLLALDGSNNIHFLNYMKSGVHITPTVTSIYGTYDLVYSPSGTLLSQVRLDLDSEWELRSAIIDPVTNKMYVCGEINSDFHGGTGVDTFYAAAFDASRNRLWMYFAGHGNDDALTGIVMDKNKHLLFSGAAQGGSSGPLRFVFNGDSTIAGATGDIAIVMKTDTNGTVKWMRRFDSYLSVNGINNLTLLPNNKVAGVGTIAGTIKSGTDSFISTGQDPYVVIVDSAGDVQVVQGIRGDGFQDGGTAITSDRVGNIYVGGYVEDSIVEGGGIPAYHAIPGSTDFFVLKYGVDCSCTSMPIATYTDTGTHTIGFIYTGSTSGIDSVVWTFDDGHSATGPTAIHTYTASGTYRACATVYTDCGNDIYCKDVVIHYSTTASAGLSKGEVKVYPNPATDELNITGVQENTSYSLLTVTGISVAQGVLRQGGNTISTHSVSPGIYILEMLSETGQREIVRVVKN